MSSSKLVESQRNLRRIEYTKNLIELFKKFIFLKSYTFQKSNSTV